MSLAMSSMSSNRWKERSKEARNASVYDKNPPPQKRRPLTKKAGKYRI